MQTDTKILNASNIYTQQEHTKVRLYLSPSLCYIHMHMNLPSKHACKHLHLYQSQWSRETCCCHGKLVTTTSLLLLVKIFFPWMFLFSLFFFFLPFFYFFSSSGFPLASSPIQSITRLHISASCSIQLSFCKKSFDEGSKTTKYSEVRCQDVLERDIGRSHILMGR